jgi:gliding motility-associated-like protein
MLRIFLIFNLLITTYAVACCQNSCPAFPEFPKSAVLSYTRLPGGTDTTFNVRFFYKITDACGIAPVVMDLAIMDLRDNTIIQDIPWQQPDSTNNVTGVIDPCVILATPPCHTNFYYHADVQLPVNLRGYVAASDNCCRPWDLANLAIGSPYNNNSYNEQVSPVCPQAAPGGPPACGPCIGTLDNGMVNYIRVPPAATVNSSPKFISADTLLSICQNRTFSYQVQALDPDGDSIAYHFSQPRTFDILGTVGGGYPKETLPFDTVAFNAGFSAAWPAGPNVIMDPITGLISGSIADTGTYDLTISALEYRGGVLLDSIMTELYVEVYNCSLLPKPKASIPPLITNCENFTATFPNNSTPIYTDVNWDYTSFLWNFGDGATSGQTYPTHTYADTGAYEASVIIFPGLYCADTAYSRVLIYPFLQPSFTYDDSCQEQPVRLANTSVSTGSGNIDLVRWNIFNDSTEIDSVGGESVTIQFNKAPQTYTVVLTVGTDKGCMSKDTQYINIWPAPYPLAVHDTILSYGATLQLQANDGFDNSLGHFLWTPEEGLSNPDIANPIVSWNQEITYYVHMTNYYGCSLRDSIHIQYYKGPQIYVPNAFTPNGDGKNDVLRAFPVGLADFQFFRVFNRMGQLMFSTARPELGWDGTINGRPAPAGTYVWEAAGLEPGNRTMIRKGTVILIR